VEAAFDFRGSVAGKKRFCGRGGTETLGDELILRGAGREKTT